MPVKKVAPTVNASDQSLGFWKSFADNDFLCFLVTDNQGKVTFINRAGEKMYGYQAKELIGRDVSLLYQGIKLYPSIASLVISNAEKGKPWEAEIWNVRKDGSKFPIWIATHYLLDDQGDRIGALSISRDISGDVKARGQAQYLAGLAQQSELALISTDREGVITSVNRAAELLFGYDADEMLGKPIRILYSPKNPRSKINSLMRQIEAGRGYIAQLYRRRKDGSEFLTGLSTAPLYDEAGELTGFLGIGRDITEEADAQEQLSYTAELVNRAHFCILSTDRDGIIRSINPAGERMYGYSAQEMIGRDRSILYQGIQLTPEKFRLLQKKMKKREGWVTELENVRKDGQVFPVRLATAYLDDEEGKRKGAVSIAQDITEEVKLRNQIIETEKLVSLGQAAAGIAHEINNPLNALLNIAHILAQEKCLRQEPEKAQLLVDLKAEINRLGQLTTDFMQFARPRPIVKEEVDLNQVIREAARLFRLDREFSEGITYILKLEDLDPLPADPNQIKQVIINIVRNAVQAMKGRGEVTISSFQTDEKVGFIIRDQGPGIPEETRERLWEPFYSNKKQGSGLGMSICRQIVNQHQGEIGVESESGVGTEITVCFPRGE